jgi:hypothetical protein
MREYDFGNNLKILTPNIVHERWIVFDSPSNGPYMFFFDGISHGWKYGVHSRAVYAKQRWGHFSVKDR